MVFYFVFMPFTSTIMYSYNIMYTDSTASNIEVHIDSIGPTSSAEIPRAVYDCLFAYYFRGPRARDNIKITSS